MKRITISTLQDPEEKKARGTKVASMDSGDSKGESGKVVIEGNDTSGGDANSTDFGKCHCTKMFTCGFGTNAHVSIRQNQPFSYLFFTRSAFG